MKTFTQKLSGSILTLIICLSAWQLNAQQTKRCGTMEHHEWLLKTNPQYAESFQQNESSMRKWIQNHPQQRSNAAPDTIPVVVHVVYKTALQNISDAQVRSQIDVLNEDWGKTNADTINTPLAFQALAGSMPYRFVLARRDPNGNATSGIVRVLTATNSFTTNNAMKFSAQGGSDSWDVDTYLNIWVCNMSGGILGYAEFPTATSSNTFGYVCLYNAFGRVGTLMNTYNLGRTTTHEIGHCFNLFHIWGDDGTSCTGSDQVMDTPNQAGENYGCPAYPRLDACATVAPGAMTMNYMDYTDDACMNMFTLGQAVRMEAALTNFYPTLINSIGILSVNLAANDAGISTVISPSTGICNSSFIPVVTLSNWGSANLTTATVSYKVDNNAVQTYAWTGNLASLATVNITLPSVTSTAGAHTFTCYTTLPNGNADPNAANDSATSSFAILGVGAATPLTQSFNTAVFPPTGYTLNNPDGAATWEQGNGASHTGAGAMFIDNYNYNGNGQIDELVLPGINLSTSVSPVLNFWVAYQLYTNPSSPQAFADTLEVLVSTDCGVTFSSIYKKSSVALTTTTPTFSTIQFVPTATQWRNEIVTLGSIASANNAIFKFRNITDYENNLYVDDINIQSATGLSSADPSAVIEVYPNPGNGYFNVNITNAVAQNLTLTVTDAIGKTILKKQYNTQSLHEVLDLSKNESGVYLLTIETVSGSVTRKLIIAE